MDAWNILLVDDAIGFISTLAERLELRGVNARVTYDGESALKAVAENEPQVMVFADVQCSQRQNFAASVFA